MIPTTQSAALAAFQAATPVGGTWDAGTLPAVLALSGDNLTVTHPSGDAFGVVTGTATLFAMSSFNLLVNIGASDGVGTGLANSSVGRSAYLGSDANGAAYLPDGTVRRNGSNLATGLPTWGNGDQVFMEMSGDNTAFRFKKGVGGAWSSYITHGVTGPLISASYLFYSGHSITANFSSY
jgi:hypothetical protein